MVKICQARWRSGSRRQPITFPFGGRFCNSGGYCGSVGRSSGEVRGDGGACAGPRVEEQVNTRLEALSRTAYGTEG